MFLFIIFLIYSCTFVGMNDKMQDNYKSGFFVVVGLLAVVGGLLKLLLG